MPVPFRYQWNHPKGEGISKAQDSVHVGLFLFLPLHIPKSPGIPAKAIVVGKRLATETIIAAVRKYV
jgi:hypothetical protein